MTMTITVSTKIKAPIDKVWESWTKEEHIVNWNFASDEWCCPSAKNDLQPGGTFSWRMEAKDGSMGFDFEGTYEEIGLNERITYKMTDGRMVEIRFEQEGDMVNVLESFEAEGSNADEQQKAGWQAILNNFKSYVENRAE
jgi:uncharacterized protein YndB with AHSA1/START domain